MRPSLPSLLVLPLAFAAAVSVPCRLARAEPPSADLMARLAATAEGFEQVRKRASYTLDGRLEQLDGDGHVTSVKTSSARVFKDERGKHVQVLRVVENGEDKTDDARREARDEENKSDEQKKKERIEVPFTPAAQGRYVFDQVETDPGDPARVRIAFRPKEPDSHSVEGSAWVDAAAGRFLSAGFKVCKPGMLVDFIHVTMEFGTMPEVGPVVSKITFDGKGGLLFIHKHFRGSQTFSEYRLGP